MTWKNQLYFGDNLNVLREHIPDECVDLVYLDPPFNSNATYNVLFKEKTGTESAAQIQAFDDTWQWNVDSQKIYNQLITGSHQKLADLVTALHSFLGKNDMMAYLVMMAARLLELHRVLKPTGSLYLHCDPTASHYLKIVLDAVFGKENFRNEIIWHYSGWNKKLLASFESRSDIILFYGKGKAVEQKFNSWARPWKSEEEYLKIRKQKVRVDENGRKYVLSDGGGGKRVPRYLDEAIKTGAYIDNVWNIDKLNNSSKERLGYPTQKPEALLERIIKSSSNESDLVLDPFCGCGTTITVAERFNRRWIGIDITHLAIALMKARLEDTFGTECSPYIVRGVPTVLEGARALKEEDPYQFQFWALGLVKAHPLEGEKKGADRGIDGVLYFIDDDSGNPKKILIQVKSGHVNAAQIRDLRGTIEREGAVIGAFITLEPSTKPMRTEALEAGLYIPEYFLTMQVPRIQILTVEELLNGTEQLEYPRLAPEVTFKRAEKKEKKLKSKQQTFFE